MDKVRKNNFTHYNVLSSETIKIQLLLFYRSASIDKIVKSTGQQRATQWLRWGTQGTHTEFWCGNVHLEDEESIKMDVREKGCEMGGGWTGSGSCCMTRCFIFGTLCWTMSIVWGISDINDVSVVVPTPVFRRLVVPKRRVYQIYLRQWTLSNTVFLYWRYNHCISYAETTTDVFRLALLLSSLVCVLIWFFEEYMVTINWFDYKPIDDLFINHNSAKSVIFYALDANTKYYKVRYVAYCFQPQLPLFVTDWNSTITCSKLLNIG
jgi:hypothetical protein